MQMRKDVAHEIEAQFGGVASSHFLTNQNV